MGVDLEDVLVRSFPPTPQPLHLLPRIPLPHPHPFLLRLLPQRLLSLGLLPSQLLLLLLSRRRLKPIDLATRFGEKVAEWVGGCGLDCGLRDGLIVAVVMVRAVGVVRDVLVARLDWVGRGARRGCEWVGGAGGRVGGWSGWAGHC